MTTRIALSFICVGIAVCLFSPAHSATAPIADPETVLLSPMTVIDRPITELICSARFRYNLPGAGLRCLVVRKAPQWCAAKGLGVGDRIDAVDGKAIQGQGLIQFVKSSIVHKFDSSPKPVHFVFTIISPNETKPRRVEVAFDDSRLLSIVYP
jgi:hypothetical protein